MDIIGIGKPCIDILSVVNRIPGANSGAGILDFSRQGGGNVATAMVAAARLGATVGMVGVHGSCIHGTAIVEDFEYNNVDISRLIKHEGAYSDFAVILSDLETKGRSIIYRGGDIRKLQIGDLDRAYITSAAFLHLEGHGEVEKTAAEWMRSAGKKTAYDGSKYSDELRDFLPWVDYFIASEDYYQAVFGDSEDYESNCREVARAGCEVVVFTLGAKGCVGYSKTEGYFSAEGLKVNVVDTLGAGDVYHGAFLYGLVQGWPLAQVAEFSNTISGIKIGYIGGRAGLPTFETADKFIKTGELDTTELVARVEYYKNKWLFGNA